MDDSSDTASSIGVGLVSSYTIGGFIHVLLGVAFGVELLSSIQGEQDIVT